MLFSEPKIPQFGNPHRERIRNNISFSALQRAENSSIMSVTGSRTKPNTFQCSSASRKFLNRNADREREHSNERFSALQRAENSSIHMLTQSTQCGRHRFSALQRAENSSIETCAFFAHFLDSVSVLFSEPKIPQFWHW